MCIKFYGTINPKDRGNKDRGNIISPWTAKSHLKKAFVQPELFFDTYESNNMTRNMRVYTLHKISISNREHSTLRMAMWPCGSLKITPKHTKTEFLN